MKKERKLKGIFLTIDALYALTLALLLASTVVVFAQTHEPQLIQFHQLGRDYLQVNHKDNVSLTGEDFSSITGFNTTAPNPANAIASRITVYPALCTTPADNVPLCFSGQDYTQIIQVDFTALVSP